MGLFLCGIKKWVLVSVYGMLHFHAATPRPSVSYQRMISVCFQSVLYRPLGSLG